jgi:uncharacterized protein involved in outer membrane biogenesis
VLVTDSGHINLQDEALAVSLQGKPKEIRVVRLRSPIEVKGTLAHPSVGLEPGHLAAQAGAAAALGTVLTPAAAILAFVDGGLAKDANYSAVIGQGQARTSERQTRAESLVETRKGLALLPQSICLSVSVLM